jgi:hypothetical protein
MVKSKEIPSNENKPQYKIGNTKAKQQKPKPQARLLTTSANLNYRASSHATNRRRREDEGNTTMITAMLKP